MLYTITTLLGAVLGGFVAWRRNGKGFDIAQYAAVFAVIGFLLGLMMALIIARLSMG